MERHLINLLHTPLRLNKFKQIHGLIAVNYPDLIPLFTVKLLNLSFHAYARKVFYEIPLPDRTLYNTIISAHSKLSSPKYSIEFFVRMLRTDTRMDSYTIAPVLKSCSSLMFINLGRQIHTLVTCFGLDSTVFVQTALIDFYVKTGDIDSARRVFDGISVKDPVCYNCLISGYSKSGNSLAARKIFDEITDRTVASWNSMLSCYGRNGDYVEGFRLFEQMQADKCCANECTAVIMLSICSKLGDLEMGLRVKKFIDDKKLRLNLRLSTALMEMYVKCGAVDEARKQFDLIVERDAVAWTTMISGYAQNGRSSEALELFAQMKREQVKPNEVTLVSVLSACAQIGSVETGERIGNYVESRPLGLNLHLASALLGMYSKCGNMEKARQVFEKMPYRDNVTWNSMIMGLAVNGSAEDSIAHYEKMKESEIKPDEITFMGLFAACTHAGLIDLGLEYFRTMKLEYGISPQIEHYACIVDLLCRSGRLEQAYEFVGKMEIEPNSVIWGTLLSASRNHLNVELAEIAANMLIKREPQNSGNYVILANIYSSAGRWQEASKIRCLMKSKTLQKTPAYSWIEMENKVHKFLAGDTSHPHCEDVYSIVDGLMVHSTWTAHEFDSDLDP